MPAPVPSHSARWRSEMTAAYLARAVARAETDAVRRRLFEDLAAESEEQAAILAKEAGLAEETGLAKDAFRPSVRARLAAAMVARFGVGPMTPVLAAMKVRGLSAYGARLAAPGHPMPTTVEGIGRRHRSTGGWLRAAVFGVNDGLISNTSLVMGVAGASLSSEAVLMTGVAGLLAGAFSMAAGEYVSVRSQREMFEHQIAQERAELELYPDEEAEELALIYAARGVPIDDARRFARDLVANPEVALDALAREELGLNPDDLGSARDAAVSSFAAFAAGATLPLVPFALGLGDRAVPIAGGLAGAALFGVGAALSLFSGRNAVLGGARMMLIGAVAGGATFLIGRAMGMAAG